MRVNRTNSLSVLIALILGIHDVSAAQTESEKLDGLFEREWRYINTEFPETATSTGFPGQNDRWTDASLPAIERRKDHQRDVLRDLKAIDRAKLDAAGQLNYDLYRRDLEESIAGQQFPDEYLPVSQMGGVQQDLASTVDYSPARTLSDYEDIIARIDRAGARIDQEIALLEAGIEHGVTQPAVTLRDVPDQVRNQIVDDPLASPLLVPFTRMPADIPVSEQQRLREAAAIAYETHARPAFQRLHTFLVNRYIPRARNSIAATDLPDGDAWYRYNVRVRTTTSLSPREIHALGLREVARIRGEMDRIIEETGFQGDFHEFCEFLRTDPRFYFADAESLLVEYRNIAKRIDPELPSLFGTLPRLPYGVKPLPPYAEKSQTTAYYMPGAPGAARPGIFYANTYALDTRPSWEMEALTAHEAVPGHHLQIAIAQELTGVPEFRKHSGPTAFVEGWGLYAESLGSEIGLYEDPYSKFGQLTYEIWRAIRLVVDTGMHAFGWSRQQAIDYFAENSCRKLHDITVEVDRYIVWPGQALAYKIGELKFKELRAKAKRELGDDFDIRAFHDACLEHGAIPLDILERNIETWITETKRGSRE